MKKIISVILTALMLMQTTVFAVTPQVFSPIMKSDEDYIFRVAGSDKRFLLLDISEDKSSFFVLALDYYGLKAFHSEGKHKFDPKDPSSMAYFLNNEFLKFGNTSTFPSMINFKLPQSIIDYIDYNHIWQCERGGISGDAPEPYEIQCGVALLSQEELIKYSDKIGWDDCSDGLNTDYITHPWAIRATTDDGVIACIRPNVNATRIMTYGSTAGVIGIRPCFWLKKEFFRDNKLELSSLGKGAAEIFPRYFTKETMKKLYTERQCYDYLGYLPDVTVSLSGNNITLNNNRNRNIEAILLTTWFGEGNLPIGQSSGKITFAAGKSQTAVLDTEYPEDALYAEVSVITQNIPYNYISNAIRINLDENIK